MAGPALSGRMQDSNGLLYKGIGTVDGKKVTGNTCTFGSGELLRC